MSDLFGDWATKHIQRLGPIAFFLGYSLADEDVVLIMGILAAPPKLPPQE